MKRGLVLLFGALLFAAGRAAAQDATVQDDLRFVQELRKQGKSDLALEYLQKLAKNPSPAVYFSSPRKRASSRRTSA